VTNSVPSLERCSATKVSEISRARSGEISWRLDLPPISTAKRGAAGADTLSGNAGGDTLVFGPGAGDDSIPDFVAGSAEDTISFVAYDGSGVTWSIAQIGADTVFSFSNGDTITLIGVNAGALVQIDPWTYG
jgi:Ca2+-binding RTX toxin-like protein